MTTRPAPSAPVPMGQGQAAGTRRRRRSSWSRLAAARTATHPNRVHSKLSRRRRSWHEQIGHDLIDRRPFASGPHHQVARRRVGGWLHDPQDTAIQVLGDRAHRAVEAGDACLGAVATVEGDRAGGEDHRPAAQLKTASSDGPDAHDGRTRGHTVKVAAVRNILDIPAVDIRRQLKRRRPRGDPLGALGRLDCAPEDASPSRSNPRQTLRRSLRTLQQRAETSRRCQRLSATVASFLE